jgi:hypothetical protein
MAQFRQHWDTTYQQIPRYKVDEEDDMIYDSPHVKYVSGDGMRIYKDTLGNKEVADDNDGSYVRKNPEGFEGNDGTGGVFGRTRDVKYVRDDNVGSYIRKNREGIESNDGEGNVVGRTRDVNYVRDDNDGSYIRKNREGIESNDGEGNVVGRTRYPY